MSTPTPNSVNRVTRVGARQTMSRQDLQVGLGRRRGRRALVYRYVWRDDLSDAFDESVRVLLPVERQSVCLVRATVIDPL